MAEFQEILGMGQSRISSHLAQLKRAGAVIDRRAGKHAYYGLENFPRQWRTRPSDGIGSNVAREIPETRATAPR